MFSKLLKRINDSSARSKRVVRDVIMSLTMRGVSIVTSFLLVPITLKYLDPTQYALWLTISSIVGWIVFFDLGIGHGFRNHFTKSKTENKYNLCRAYVSTSYALISIIVFGIVTFSLLVNHFLNWSSILKVDDSFQVVLHRIFMVITIFTGLRMIFGLFNTLLLANQLAGISAVVNTIEQVLILVFTYLTYRISERSIVLLSLIYSAIPPITLLIISIVSFNFTKLKEYRPSIKYINFGLSRDILGLGMRFFIVYLCLIAIFQIVNLVITRQLGPVYLTEYSIANKYFGIIYMVINLLCIPFWSAATEAWTNKDVVWLNKVCRYFVIMSWLSLGFGGILLLISPIVYKLWIGNEVPISFSLSLAMMILISCQSYGNLFMTLVNGIGTVTIQMITYICFALIAWPLFVYLSDRFGLIGVVVVPSVVYFLQGLLGHIQIKKILRGTANGIWCD